MHSPWQLVSDSLIAGLAHALSNRAATIGALAAFTESGDPPAQLGETLGAEAERLEDLVRLLRLLAQDDEPELVHLPSLAREALALHALHRDLRGARFDVEHDGMVPPLRARRGALARALLVLLAHAARSALDAGHRRLALRIEGDARWIRLRVAPRAGIADAAPSLPLDGSPLLALDAAAVRAVAAAVGAETEEDPRAAGLALRFPRRQAPEPRRERRLALV